MKPTAAPAHFPYNHRTVREVDIDEAAAVRRERDRASNRDKCRRWRAQRERGAV